MKLKRLIALGKLRKINCYPGYSNIGDPDNLGLPLFITAGNWSSPFIRVQY